MCKGYQLGRFFPPNYSNPKVGADLRPLLPLECASARLSRPEHNAPVAQPDRVVASEAIGRGFESLRARQIEVQVWPWPHNGLLRGFSGSSGFLGAVLNKCWYFWSQDR